MKRSNILIAALTLIFGLATSLYANVYATNIEVSAEVIETGATNTTIDISFLLNEDADSGVDVKIYSGTTLVHTISLATAMKGTNSVTWDGTDAGGTTLPDGDYTFEVTASDDGNTAWTKISDDLLTVMYSPKGVSVNRNLESPLFGTVYISNGFAGTSGNTGAFYNGDGVFLFSSAQDSLAFSDGDVDWSNSSNAPGKTSIGLDDRIYVTHYGSDELYVFDGMVDPASGHRLLDGDNKVAEQWVQGNWVTGSGVDRAIYTADGHYATGQGILKYTIGLDDTLAAGNYGELVIERPNNGYYQRDVEVDSQGNIYFCQMRADPNQAYPLLKYPPYTGTTLTLADTLWTVPMTFSGAQGIAIDEASNTIAWGSYYSGTVYIHDLTAGALIAEIATGQSRTQDLAFDAAGNLYTIDNGSEYWHVWSAPDGANSFTTPGLATITIATDYVETDLDLTFEDDTDAANWGVYDGATGYTTVTHDATAGVDGSGALVFGDGGYGYFIKRPVNATVGTDYVLSVDLKTLGWDNPDTYPITLSIEGVGAEENSVSINSLTEFANIVLMGTSVNPTGYIKLQGSNTSAAGAGGTINVTIDNLMFDDDYVEADLDLDIAFEDDTDAVNWGVYDGASGYTTVTHDATAGVDGSGALVFGDGGYGFYIKRPIAATPGEDYSFSLDVKTLGWDAPDTYPVTLAIEGLGADENSVSINALTDFTTMTLTGTATNAAGYVKIAGSNTSAAGAGGTISVTIDNLMFDDNLGIVDMTPPDLVSAIALSSTVVELAFNEDIDPVSGANVANYILDHGIGAPTAAVVLEDMVTLTLGAGMMFDSTYTVIINNIADLSSNVLAADTASFMYSYEFVSDLFFSEYIEGSGNNKALEIYNPTDVGIDLAGYTIGGTSNEATDWEYFYTFPDTVALTVAPMSTFVIADAGSDQELLALADWAAAYPGPTSYNGNDARGLFRIVGLDTILIDAVGDVNNPTAADYAAAGMEDAMGEHTLVRKASLTMGNPDWMMSAGTDAASSEWVIFPQNTFRFLGTHPHDDLDAPKVLGVVAVNETTLQIRYSEAVFPDALEMEYYLIDGVHPTNALWTEEPWDDRVVILEHTALSPNTPHTLIVSGIQDHYENAMPTPDTTQFVYDVPGTLPIDRIMNDFTVDVGNWGHPTYSGSTAGILGASTFASSDSMAFAGTHSGEMVLLDDPAVSGGWFVRLWNIDRVDRIDADSKMFFYLYGGGAAVEARIVVKDDDGYEAGPWQDLTFSETDWQVVSVDLANDPVTGWITGNGSINAAGGSVAIDCIQLRCSEDVSTTLYLDMVTERYNVEPVEVTFDVNMSIYTLMETFNMSSDFVDVAGNFNGWGEHSMVLEDTGADSVYTITLTDVYPGETLEYKFRINGSWSDDTAEFPFGGPARTYVIPDSNSVVSHWYNDVFEYVGTAGMLVPTEYALHNNYPNPFNPITNIKYDIPENTHVTISVYNTLGQHVIDLVNEEQAAGYYHMQWNGLSKQGTPVGSGLYFYRLTTSDFTQTEKMTYLK